MLYLIGLGLGDAEDITYKGLAVVQQASRVYLEAYTSILTIGTEALVSIMFIASCLTTFSLKDISVCIMCK